MFVTLEDLTVLIGANNAGKTSFLEALNYAIGASRKFTGKDDIRIAAGEFEVPKQRCAIIDVLIRPVDANDKVICSFPACSFWTNIWGEGISQNDQHEDIVGLRTKLKWSEVHGEYGSERNFLKEWLPFQDWLKAEEKDRIVTAQLEPIALHFIDAKRDIGEDLQQRGSFWRRLTDDLELSESDITAFESSLTTLNQEIVEKSVVLKHLRAHLGEIRNVIAGQETGVEIAPVPRHLRDLSKGIDVTFVATGVQAFSLTRHGMGTRSLASLFVFRAFASWKQRQAQTGGDSTHTVLALEEPEAHLHPQAQRSLFAHIQSIPGQRIVSTHSPYFAGQASLDKLRLFRTCNGHSTVTALDTTCLTSDDRRKLEQKIVLTRGDILFGRALILFEGETEEQAPPIWALTYWNKSIHELGLSFVGVGGKDYYPFIWLAQSFEIPWFIFSAGEQEAIGQLNNCLLRAGKPNCAVCNNVIVLPNSNDFEQELVKDGYLPDIERAFNLVYSKRDYLDTYIAKMHGKPKKGGIIGTTRGKMGKYLQRSMHCEKTKHRWPSR